MCFDSDVMVWGALGKKQPGFEEMVDRVQKFQKQLDDDGKSILLPSIVVGELLFGIPVDRHEAVLASLNNRFIIVPFDVAAASAFAILWQQRKTDGTVASLQNAIPAHTKTELKADAMIVATAIARQAECVYSHDQGLVKIAGSRIQVREIPKVMGQTNLFPEKTLRLVESPSKPNRR